MKAGELVRRPLPNAQLWPISIAAYRHLGAAKLVPKNTELLDGLIYTKIGKLPYHSFLVNSLSRLLCVALPSDCFLSIEQPVTCGESELEPDLAVIKGKNEYYWHSHPHTAELIIEVCVNSHEYDHSKLSAFATADVKEIWFVLGPEKQIEVHRNLVDGKYLERKVYGPGGRLTGAVVPALTFDLDSLFAK